MGDDSKYTNRQLRGADDIVNSIKATRHYPGNMLLSFLIVEGDTDKTFYRPFINSDRCEITIAYGKANAVEVLSILEKEQFSGVLAIVDSDFDILTGKMYPVQNLLFTDTHDTETMVLRSPALEKILNEFGSESKIAEFIKNTGKDIRVTLIECSLDLGYLRWVSISDGLSLTFEGLDFKKFLDERILIVNTPKLIRHVKDKSQKPALVESQLQIRMQTIKDDAHDHWHVCCGHDLVDVLSVALCKAIGTCNTNDVKRDTLERSLRLAFESVHFQQTQLYLSIRNWEQMNTPFLVLTTPS